MTPNPPIHALADPALWTGLAGPLARADDGLARLDERLRASPVREGWVSRTHFTEACAALWLEGGLAHVEDLVLHDATMDVRAPTLELIRAHAILRARRRIAAEPPDWAWSNAGLARLRGGALGAGIEEGRGFTEGSADSEEVLSEDDGADDDGQPDDRNSELAIEVARSTRVIEAELAAPVPRDPLVYDLDWNEGERLQTWRALRDRTQTLPPLIASAVLSEAWTQIQPLQHRPWLGNLLVAATLRERAKTRSHLLCLNSGLRLVARERRRAGDRLARLIAWLEAVATAAEEGMKDHDRWVLARRQLERKLVGRRTTSHLAALIDLVIARPIANIAMIAKELGVTPRAAQNLVAELELREATGRGRYRAWGIL